MAVVIQNFCTEIEETSHNNRHCCRIASTNTNRRRASFYNSVAYYLQVFGRRQFLIRTTIPTQCIYPYKKPWVLCLYFQVQYTFGPLYSFLVRGPFDRDNIHTWLFSKFILFDWQMRSLIASSRATCPTRLHLPSLRKQCSLAWERNSKGRVKLCPVYAMKTETQYYSFLSELLAQQKNLLPLIGIVQS